jgi:hypothetical protein
MKDLPKKDKKALQEWSKVIAMNIRNQMEEFHCKHLNDDQMKELNPIIRKATYEVLRQLYFLKKGTKKQRLVAVQQVHYLLMLLPKCWDAPDLTDEDRVHEEELAARKMTKRLVLFGKADSRQAFADFFQKHLGVFDYSDTKKMGVQRDWIHFVTVEDFRNVRPRHTVRQDGYCLTNSDKPNIPIGRNIGEIRFGKAQILPSVHYKVNIELLFLSYTASHAEGCSLCHVQRPKFIP